MDSLRLSAQLIEAGCVEIFHHLASKRVANLWQNHIFLWLHELLTHFQSLDT